MKRSLGLYLNIGIGVVAIVVIGLVSLVLREQANLRGNEGKQRQEKLMHAYENHRGALLRVDGARGRSAHFLRIEDQRVNGWLSLIYLRCPPSALPGDDNGTATSRPGEPGAPSMVALREARIEFDGCPFPRLIEVGNQAKEYIDNVLDDGHYELLSRWARDSSDNSYAAFIRVRTPEGDKRYLHELLIEQGLAYPVRFEHPGPFGETPEELWTAAQEALAVARREQHGAFQHELDDPDFRPPIDYSGDALRGSTWWDQISEETRQRVEAEDGRAAPNNGSGDENGESDPDADDHEPPPDWDDVFAGFPNADLLRQTREALDDAERRRAVLVRQRVEDHPAFNPEELAALDQVIGELNAEMIELMPERTPGEEMPGEGAAGADSIEPGAVDEVLEAEPVEP